MDSGSQALETPLSPNFKLWELIGVDVRETPLMRDLPALRSVRGRAAGRRARTVPPGSRHLCARGRQRRLSLAGVCAQPARPRHCWGTANIYRIGDTWLDSREEIENADIARRA